MATKKKVNKIVTPIDQRETFVSLQKNMADTDSIAMEQKLRTLYRIQQTDTKIDKIYLLRGELPLEVQDLEDEIAGLHTRIDAAKAEIREIEKANAEHKHVIEESKHLIAKYDAQRDNVKNNREYESISKEIEYQDLEQQVSAKKIRENEVLISEKKQVIEDAQQQLAHRESDLADFHALARGHAFRMDTDGIAVDGRMEIGFRFAVREDLHLPDTAFSGSFSRALALDALRSFLGEHTDRGLTELVFDRSEGMYARFLAPRFIRLRQAAQESDESLISAAYDVAGCGEGLTPSSDDLLCGYLLCASAVRGRDVAAKAAYRAAERTNDISASLLRRAGDGLFSKDVLSLIGCLGEGGTKEREALERVAAFGSSSGCDFLTGLYFGILDFINGKEAM